MYRLFKKIFFNYQGSKQLGSLWGTLPLCSLEPCIRVRMGGHQQIRDVIALTRSIGDSETPAIPGSPGACLLLL